MKLEMNREERIMELTPEMITLGTELATVAGRMTVEAIFDRIRVIKGKGNKDEIINNLEEIISELIADKNNLIRISQAYEEKLITQKMTEKEIDYITESVVPLIEEMLKQSNGEDIEKMQEGLNILKQLLSKEMFNIMQMLGFNFKKAIGEPLTELLASLIRSKVVAVEKNVDMQQLSTEREIEFYKVCQDGEAYDRLMALCQR